MKENSVAWISHRGSRVHALENSREAFDAAIKAGFTRLETDLRATADGFIVLHHDPNVFRTFGRDIMIASATYSELSKLRGPHGELLMTFEAFIESYAGFGWTFDIKPETADKCLAILKKWALEKNAESWLNEQARFLCWNVHSERFLKQLFPSAQSLARESECYRAGLAVFLGFPSLGGIKKGRTYALPRRFAGRDLFTQSVVKSYHRLGAKILAYLPATEADALAAVEAGFDEILTDHVPASLA